jgi:aminoglycoside phosphotransferase (APT) family kinase protein
VFTLQDAAAGQAASERDAAGLVADVLAAIELQRDQGDLESPPWPGWLLETIDAGGDGYCVHATMRAAPGTSRLLDRLIALAGERRVEPVRDRDLVHFDLNPANLLSLDGKLTAIVDWNVPFTGAAQGDRGFDLATLLFYLYDAGGSVRELLRERCHAVSGEAWTSIYLAHLILRQVEWSLRRSPGTARAAYHLDLAQRVLDEID